jgi:hypothetical protein
MPSAKAQKRKEGSGVVFAPALHPLARGRDGLAAVDERVAKSERFGL